MRDISKRPDINALIEANIARFTELYRTGKYAPRYPAEWIVRAMAQHVGKQVPGGQVLDFGAGAGNNSKFFHEPGYSVVATEACEEAIELIRSTTGPDINSVPISAIEPVPPFDSEAFDIIMASMIGTSNSYIRHLGDIYSNGICEVQFEEEHRIGGPSEYLYPVKNEKNH